MRLTEVLTDLPSDAWDTPVEACPGWRVRDVIGHLHGVVEDVEAGVLSGPPDEAQTAAEVERHRDDDPVALLAAWNASAEPFEELVSAMSIWPAAIDSVSHEHDIRGALGRPGARDDESVLVLARLLVSGWSAPRPVVVDLDDGPAASSGGEGEPLRLATTSFEVVRARLGRRSRAQVAALPWSDDPTAVLDTLFVFGPRHQDLVE